MSEFREVCGELLAHMLGRLLGVLVGLIGLAAAAYAVGLLLRLGYALVMAGITTADGWL